jgi:hypothetical protein
MLVAKCSVCKIKKELQACMIYEEAKCAECAEKHRIEIKTKWMTIETRISDIMRKKSKKYYWFYIRYGFCFSNKTKLTLTHSAKNRRTIDASHAGIVLNRILLFVSHAIKKNFVVEIKLVNFLEHKNVKK